MVVQPTTHQSRHAHYIPTTPTILVRALIRAKLIAQLLKARVHVPDHSLVMHTSRAGDPGREWSGTRD